MSQNLAQLCSLLIEDAYGPLYAHIFSALTIHGRLSARDISKKCHLPLRQVIAGLGALVQCLFVFHHSGPDGRTSYQANTTAACNIVRVGRFTQLMRHKFGRDGAKISSHLLVFGHDNLENLQKVPSRTEEAARSHGCYLEASMAEDCEAGRELVELLIDQDYLIKVRPAHFQTWSDTWRAAEMAVKASGNLSNAKGKKGQEELEIAVRAEVEKRLYGEMRANDVNTNGKRAAIVESRPSTLKKQKLKNGVLSAGATTERLAHLDGQCSLRLNQGKLLLVLQHEMIARRVRHRMGSQSGHVLAALLRQCETRTPAEGDSQRPPSSERPDTNAHYAQIDMDQLLDDVNAHKDILVVEHQSRHNGLANGYVNGKLNHPDEIDMEELEDQVATLAEGSCDFILRDEDSGDWKIDVHDAEDRLRDDEVMQMVRRRFGLMSLRIIRILISRGKVDEKALQEIGLLNAKDLRRCLAQLNAHGFIDLQEVPREPQRQPARTIYLWFYDPERVRKRVLENLYKSMCRLLQRLKVERQNVSSTLQKAERSDVKGKEHEMLRSDEIAVLKHWRRKELWYLSELERLGCSVDVLQVARFSNRRRMDRRSKQDEHSDGV